MQTPTAPAVALDSNYTETHGAATDCGERELWRGVLRQAGDDLRDSDPAIRQDALSFFFSSYFLQILDFAGISRDDAPWLRERALELAEVPAELRQHNARLITYRGQTHSLTEWSRVTNISVYTLCHRLRYGWTVERALTTPSQRRTATADCSEVSGAHGKFHQPAGEIQHLG